MASIRQDREAEGLMHSVGCGGGACQRRERNNATLSGEVLVLSRRADRHPQQHQALCNLPVLHHWAVILPKPFLVVRKNNKTHLC